MSTIVRLTTRLSPSLGSIMFISYSYVSMSVGSYSSRKLVRSTNRYAKDVLPQLAYPIRATLNLVYLRAARNCIWSKSDFVLYSKSSVAMDVSLSWPVPLLLFDDDFYLATPDANDEYRSAYLLYASELCLLWATELLNEPPLSLTDPAESWWSRLEWSSGLVVLSWFIAIILLSIISRK